MKLDNRDIKIIMLIVTVIDLTFLSLFINANENNGSGTYKQSIITQSEIEEDDEANMEILPGNETVNEGLYLNISASEAVKKNDDYYGSRDSVMENIFYERIIGKYRINDSMVYKFGMNGIYSGFFDDNSSNVSGYSYEIVVVNEAAELNIYNVEKNKVVTYQILLLDDESIALYYPNSNLKIILKE